MSKYPTQQPAAVVAPEVAVVAVVVVVVVVVVALEVAMARPPATLLAHATS